MNELDAYAERIFDAVKAYCGSEFERHKAIESERLLAHMRAELDKRIAAIPPGRDGAPGADGKDGAPGRDGKDGAAGQPGEAGAAGRDGASGADGKDGTPGRDGKDGASGRDGIDGKDGAPGLNGKDGAPGIKGEDGRDGRDGKEGAPGRDALRLDVLEHVDAERSYPRNTYAVHGGGVIRSFRTTDPITAELEKSGWHVVVRGIAEETEVSLKEGRIIERTTVYTDGTRFVRQLHTNALIYRGVWREGGYEAGDTVTRDGGMWHCQRDTSAQPGQSPDWLLAARRGTDGRNGKDGAPGERGQEGKPGRDFTKLGATVS
jgi:hypothetical protein